MKPADPLYPHIEAVCSGPLAVVGEGPQAHRSGIDKRPLPAGAFGENLRLVGVDPTGARSGERWRLGLEVEVTTSRA